MSPKCEICHESIRTAGTHSWIHEHGDVYCGTGDGATAYPELDTSSSASRQHYIDTGEYLPTDDDGLDPDNLTGMDLG